jgi:hypothetical protein
MWRLPAVKGRRGAGQVVCVTVYCMLPDCGRGRDHPLILDHAVTRWNPT